MTSDPSPAPTDQVVDSDQSEPTPEADKPADDQTLTQSETDSPTSASSTGELSPVEGEEPATVVAETDSATDAEPDADTEPATDAQPAGGEPADDSTPRRKIQIGRDRRDLQGNPIKSSRPQTPGAESGATADLPRPSSEPVPTPSVRDKLSDDLEQEIAAAMGAASIEQVMDSGFDVEITVESRLRAKVVRIDEENAFFALGGRNQGVAPIRSFETPPEIGQVLDVVVIGEGADDGLFELAVPGSAVQVNDWADVVEGTVVDARITGANTGGLECMVGNIRGFIPASQIGIFRVENFAEYINQKLPCVVTEANRRRKNLVLSHRAILERQKEEDRKKLMETLEVGQVREGIVRNLRDFGAFVDIGGVDGLIHISQLSWDRVEHPKEVLKVNQTVSVRIEKIDPQTGKIGLSYRALQENPWDNISERFAIGGVATGTVTRVAKFGAFVKIAVGVEGLVHISELAHEHVRQVGQVVQEGQEVSVKVLSVDEENQRIALSIKATVDKPAEPEVEEPEEVAPVQQKKKRSKPLRGGFDRPTGGDEFGLKW